MVIFLDCFFSIIYSNFIFGFLWQFGSHRFPIFFFFSTISFSHCENRKLIIYDQLSKKISSKSYNAFITFQRILTQFIDIFVKLSNRFSFWTKWRIFGKWRCNVFSILKLLSVLSITSHLYMYWNLFTGLIRQIALVLEWDSETNPVSKFSAFQRMDSLSLFLLKEIVKICPAAKITFNLSIVSLHTVLAKRWAKWQRVYI